MQIPISFTFREIAQLMKILKEYGNLVLDLHQEDQYANVKIADSLMDRIAEQSVKKMDKEVKSWFKEKQ
jgi:uncharacterized protein YaaW (UPF0174 family)